MSLLTDTISGLQSRSAINNAVDDLLRSYGVAGETGRLATGVANQEIKNDAWHQGDMVKAASQDAGNWATDAANTGIAGVNDAVSKGQAGLQPWIANGATAGDTLTRMLTKPDQFQYQADPGYQFRLSEGQKQISRMAAAHGAAGGGGTAKALAQYNSGLASQEYGNAWNRWNTGQQERIGGLSTLAGMGERAGETSGQWGVSGSQFNAGLGENAAQYAGNMWDSGTKWAGAASMDAVKRTTTNDLDYANFLANLQLDGGKTQAAGQMARANVWNQYLGKLDSDFGAVLKGAGVKGF